MHEEINTDQPFNYFIPALGGFLFCTIVAISFRTIILCTLLKVTYQNLEPMGEFKLKYYFDHSQLVSYLLAIPYFLRCNPFRAFTIPISSVLDLSPLMFALVIGFNVEVFEIDSIV